jgi:hypothetical protein
MLEQFTAELDRRGIKYFLFFGTLLGAVRDGAIIPYTPDVDVYIPELGRQNWPEGHRRFFSEPFRCFEVELDGVDMNWSNLIHVRSKAPWVEIMRTGRFGWRPVRAYIDVYSSELCTRMDENVQQDAIVKTGRCENDQRYLWGTSGELTGRIFLDDADFDPGSRVTVGGREYPAPRDPEGMLEKLYGLDWRKPDPSFNPDAKGWSVLRRRKGAGDELSSSR